MPDTPLEGTADISVKMVAPNTPGSYKGIWQMQSPDGVRFGDTVDVQIVVEWSPPRRLATGTIIKQAGAMNGEGHLKVENGLDLDGIAVLTWMNDETMIAVYIQNHSSHTITGIPDGLTNSSSHWERIGIASKQDSLAERATPASRNLSSSQLRLPPIPYGV